MVHQLPTSRGARKESGIDNARSVFREGVASGLAVCLSLSLVGYDDRAGMAFMAAIRLLLLAVSS